MSPCNLPQQNHANKQDAPCENIFGCYFSSHMQSISIVNFTALLLKKQGIYYNTLPSSLIKLNDDMNQN